MRSAITLIEVVLVVVILAASAGIGAMATARGRGSDFVVDEVADALADHLRLGRQMAVSHAADVRIELRRGVDHQNRRVEILTWRHAGGKFVTPESNESQMHPNVRIATSNRRVDFRPDGTTNRPIRWTISHARGDATADAVIEVDPITGFVTRR